MNDPATLLEKCPGFEDALNETQQTPVSETQVEQFDIPATGNDGSRCTLKYSIFEDGGQFSPKSDADSPNTLLDEIKSLKEQNENLRSSLEKSNLARDDVVEKLKDVSFETRELIDNCEKASEECNIFKMKSDMLEEELQKMKDQNKTLLIENEILRDNIESMRDEIQSQGDTAVIDADSWQSEVRGANQVLSDVSPLIGNVLEELKRSNQKRSELEQELALLRTCNENLCYKIGEKDEGMRKQNIELMNMKKVVDDYEAEIVRLDSELQDCRIGVSSFNENLNSTLSADDIDLVEYTNFKNTLKKLDMKEKADEALRQIRILHEIEELFDVNKNVSDQLNDFDRNDDVNSKGSSKTDRIKYHVEKLICAFDKLNEKSIRLAEDSENEIRAKSNEIAILKEILTHTTLYNEILQQRLKQCREDASIDKFVEGKSDELIVANNASPLENFKALREIYCASRSCNDALFAKYRQLNLCYKLLKINFENSRSPVDNVHSLFYLMGELFDEIFEESVRFERHKKASYKIFGHHEANLATKDYLKTTVDTMTSEVERLTGKVEQEVAVAVAEKIREIELLRNEADAMKTDNHELVNKVKNCNREIISLSSENYDLNEKLQMLSKNQLQSLKSKFCDYENRCPKEFQIGTIREICREGSMSAKRDIEALKESDRLPYLDIPGLEENRLSALSVLREKCQQIRGESRHLGKNVQLAKELMLKELASLNTHFNNLAILKNQKNSNWKSSLSNLETVSKDLKRECKEMKDLDFTKPLKDTLLMADTTLKNKLDDIVASFEAMQCDLNVSVTSEIQRKNLISSHAAHLLIIVQDLKTFHQFFLTFAKAIPAEFSNCTALLLRSIQETTSRTFDHMKASLARSDEEMIKEMQEMNSELKKRGETISTLYKTIDESAKEKENFCNALMRQEKLLNDLKIDIAEKNLQNQTLNEELANVKEQLDVEKQKMEKITAELLRKEETIANLEYEISKSRDMQDGDVSSMGNISRTEEVSRLKDVEDSFEERYLKLRFVAIKMKKNIAELNLQLKTEKAERAAVQGKLNATMEQAKRNQALQEECDKITDELELKYKEIKELKKSIVETQKQNDEMKLRCDDLNEKTASLSKTNDSLKNENKELELKMENASALLKNLEKEKFVEEMLKKEREKEIQQLKQKIKEKEEFIKKIQINLEQAKLEARKQSVLNLEMRDYEKTISDLTEKLKKKENAVKELNEKMKIGTESNVSLIERIKQLEEQIASYGASNKIADEQILNLNSTILKCEKNLEIKDAVVKQLTLHIEEEKSEKEKLILQLATAAAEMNTLKQLHDTKQQAITVELKSSLHKINNLEEKVRKKENEFCKLKEDFESYKIRAHNVLQKLKSENSSKNAEETLRIEIDNLTANVKELRKRLDDALYELGQQRTALKLVEEAKEKLQFRTKELNEAILEKKKELDNIRAEMKSRELNYETRVRRYTDDIAQLKVACANYKAEVEELKIIKECENIERNGNFKQTNEENENLKSLEDNNCHSINDNAQECNSRNEKENLSGRRKSHAHPLISLEKLLETDTLEEKKGEVTELGKNITLLESQVNYLSGILNESEKNAARNEQQVALLKDEIRRLQKTIERAPHLQNGEYLKNVLFNFFTFPDGEEKCRFITILETLLQLTAEETETLSAIAKGYRVEQKRASGSGLSSMFRMW